jgi:hypothetical protein
MSMPREEEEVREGSFLRSPAGLLIAFTMLCFLLFAGGTVWYTTWSVNNSQRNFCTVVDLLNNAPVPDASVGKPARAYDAKLAQDLRALQQILGC